MLPLSDGVPARRFPVVNAHVGGFTFRLIVAGVLTSVGRIAPQGDSGLLRAPA